MENNQSNITEETKSNTNLENNDEQAQQNEKTFSQEEVFQMIKDLKNQYELEKLLKENEELKAEKALSQMKNETRTMLNEFGVQNFDEQIVNVLVKS